VIIKSLSRKGRGAKGVFAGARVRASGKASASSPFANLAAYMNRGIEEEEGRAVLWRNLYANDKTTEQDLVREFEGNAARLRARANGNVLYHEILSFSAGHQVKDEVLFRAIADIGDEYLSRRAPHQLAYGVIHRDTEHVHLHLMVSANNAGQSDRVRLSKKDFADVQKEVERIALERYPELAQTKVYTKERGRERLKTKNREQAARQRSGTPSRKEALKSMVHAIFERATTPADLARMLEAEGLAFYTRGKSVGLIEREAGGGERRHRLATLGVLEHYEVMNTRLMRDAAPPERETQEASMKHPNKPGRDAFSRPDTAAEIAMDELVTGKLSPEWHDVPEVGDEPGKPRTYTDEVLRRAREPGAPDKGTPGQDRGDGSGGSGGGDDRER
jgi:hypothetical protein